MHWLCRVGSPSNLRAEFEGLPRKGREQGNGHHHRKVHRPYGFYGGAVKLRSRAVPNSEDLARRPAQEKKEFSASAVPIIDS